jgi:hypothetical protein
MKTETIQIVERGRGPQLSTSRLTVLDVFYYLLDYLLNPDRYRGAGRLFLP